MMFNRLFCCVWLLTAVSCVNDMRDVQQTSDAAKPGVETGKDVDLYYSEDGILKLHIYAPVLIRYQTNDPYVEFTQGLKVDFYDEHKVVISRLSAQYGIRYEQQLKTIVQHNVLVVNEAGEQLSTEELIWDEKRHIIYSDKFVRITTEDEVLYGTGLEADERMTEYTILNPEGIIKIDMNDAETNENF